MSALFTPAAVADVESYLLARLSEISVHTLYAEFVGFRIRSTSGLNRLVARAADAPSTTAYESFVVSMRRGGMQRLIRRHPALGRMVARLTDLWVDATCELVCRLAADLTSIGDELNAGHSPGRVAAAQVGLSDPHKGARTVASLTFDGGTSIVYKPKDVGIDSAFGRFLAWLAELGAPFDLSAPAIIARNGYGWFEHLANDACADHRAVSRFYERAGMLTAIVYLLSGTDCHRENLIANGEYPVLVDAECLLQPRPVRRSAPDAETVHERALDEMAAGVLGTGLLPSWQVDEGDSTRAWDISALHTPDEAELTAPVFCWDRANTDAMVPRVLPTATGALRNLPWVERAPVRLKDHASDLLRGFEGGYEFLMEQRDRLLADDSPLYDLLNCPIRFLFRNTRVYGALYQELADPRYLRDGLDRSIRFERLARAMNPPELPPEDPRWWPVVLAECKAMDDGDVPFIGALPYETSLFLDTGANAPDCLREPPSALVLRRVGTLSRADLAQQAAYIAGSLHSNNLRRDVVVSHEISAAATSPTVPGTEAPDLIASAIAIADEIARHAVTFLGQDRAATWIAPQYVARLERYQLQPLSYDLHSGVGGPALFLAAVQVVTGQTGYDELIRGALRPLVRSLRSNPPAFAAGLGLGAATGIGSVVYVLSRIGSLLGDDELIESACTAAELSFPPAPALDVFAGIAGEILGLLALHEVCDDRRVLDKARSAGERLIEGAVPAASDSHGWATMGEKMLTGFSHGSAGISYALLRLYRATGDKRFEEAALAGITYEDQLLDLDAGNWYDLREDEQPSYKANWCHGAPGIGLARIGGLDVADSELIRRDVDVAITTTLTSRQDGPDHLCCGNLGRVEFLVSAGHQLGLPALIREARERTDEIVRRAHEAGSFQLPTALPGRVHLPGFFMGLSGVGYEILRIAHPEAVPSVLLWQ